MGRERGRRSSLMSATTSQTFIDSEIWEEDTVIPEEKWENQEKDIGMGQRESYDQDNLEAPKEEKPKSKSRPEKSSERVNYVKEFEAFSNGISGGTYQSNDQTTNSIYEEKILPDAKNEYVERPIRQVQRQNVDGKSAMSDEYAFGNERIDRKSYSARPEYREREDVFVPQYREYTSRRYEDNGLQYDSSPQYAPSRIPASVARYERDGREAFRPQPYEYAQMREPRVNRSSIEPKIIASYSPKGGPGKSTIANALADMYSSMKINGKPMQVLLVDFDYESADVATNMNIKPTPSLANWITDIHAEIDAVGGIESVSLYTEAEIRQRYLIHYKENYDVLAGIEYAIDASSITDDDIALILQSLRNCHYDVIVIDSANSTAKRTILPLREADNIALITTLDTATIKETLGVLDMLEKSQFDRRKIRLIFNRVPQDKDIDMDFSELTTLLRMEPIAIVNEDDNIRKHMNMGDSYCLRKPKTQFAEAIKKIANNLYPVDEEIQKKGLFSFITKLFSKKNR